MYNRETELKIDRILDLLNEQVSNAKKEFEKKIEFITNQASARVYDVTELNKVLQLVKDVKAVSDEAYATYEMAVRTLDSQCTLLEKDGISNKNLNDIVIFLKDVNELSSSITNNFSLSLFGGAESDVGNLSYVASIEAMAIQKKWEMKYFLYEESDEEKQERARINKEISEQLEKEREEKEQIRKREEAELKAEADAWEKQFKETINKRETEKKIGYAEIEEREAKRKTEINAQKKQKVEEISIELKRTQEDLEKHKQELSTLSVLKFGRKKELNHIIQTEEKLVKRLKGDKSEILVECKRDLDLLVGQIAEEKSRLSMQIDEKYPLPEKPEERKKRLAEERGIRERRENLFKGEEGEVRELLLNVLGSSSAKTISQMREQEYELAGRSSTVLNRYLRELEEFGYVEHVVVKGQSYYGAVKKYMDAP